MAQYDGSVRIDTSIITKNIRPKVQEIVKSLEEIGKDAEKAREKLDLLDKAGVSHSSEEYKTAQAELQKYVDSYKDSMYKIAEYGQGVSDSLQFDTSKIDAAREKLQSLEDSGIDHSSKEYKEAERDLNHVIDAYEQYQEVIDEFDSYTKNAFDGFKKLRDETEKYINTSDTQAESADEVSQHLNILRIDVEEYAKALKELHDQGKFFGDEDYNKIYLAWKNATDAVKAYQSELNKQTEAGQAKIAEQEAKAAEKKEAAQRRAEEQAERALQKENARIQKEIENQAKLEAREAERKAKEEARIAAIQAKEEAKRAKEVASIREQETEEQRLAEIRENVVVGNQRIVEVMERRKQLVQEISDMEQAGVGTGYQQYDSAVQELAAADQEIKDYNNDIKQVKESYSKLGAAAKKAFSVVQSAISKAGSGLKKFGGFVKSAFSNLTKSVHKSNSTLGTLGSRFKSLALSLLIFNQISKAFNAMISGMKEGFGNLYNEIGGFKNSVDGLKASMLTLKNSFAAAFRPLVEIAIPYIQKAIDALASLMNIIGQFTAAITGQKTYTKVIKQTTAALEEAKEAEEGYLSPLDEINKYQTKDSSGSGGASENMFEENVPIKSSLLDMYQNMKDLIENQDWEGLGAYIAGELNKGLQKIYDVINWNNIGPQITYFVTAFTGAFNGLVENLDWNLLGRTIGSGINTIVNTLYLLITGIDWVNLGIKFSDGLNGLVNEIDTKKIGNLIGEKFMIIPRILLGFVSNLEWSEIGKKIAESLNGIVESINLSDIGKLLGTALTGMLQMAVDFSETFEWHEFGENIADGINNFFKSFDAEKLATGLNVFVDGIVSSISAILENLTWEDIFSKVGDFLGNLEIDTVAVIIGGFAITHGGVPLTYNIIKNILLKAMGANISTGLLKLSLAIGVTILAIELVDAARPILRDFGLKISEAITGEAVDIDILNNLVKGSSFDLDMSVVDMIKKWWNSLIAGSLLTEEDRGLMQKVLDHYFGEGTFDVSTYLNFGASWEKVKENWENFIIPFIEWVAEDGANVVSGFLGGIEYAFSGIGDWINEHIFTPFINGFKSLFGIHSPSTVMAELGSFLMEGLLNGIQSLVDSVSAIWESMKETAISLWESVKEAIYNVINNIKTIIVTVMNTIRSIWINIWNAIKSFLTGVWNGIRATISNIINSIKIVISTALNTIRTTWNTIWTSMRTTVVNIFNGIWSAIKGVINRILGGIEGMANGVINGMNSMIGALNSIHISIPDWVPGLGGKSFGINLGYLGNVSIPRLATGTVVPPNNEFLAVLGDNKREPEVVSPISTMKQAFLEAIAESGGVGSGKPVNITLQVSLDRKVLGQTMVDWGKLQQMATGNNPYALGTT